MRTLTLLSGWLITATLGVTFWGCQDAHRTADNRASTERTAEPSQSSKAPEQRQGGDWIEVYRVRLRPGAINCNWGGPMCPLTAITGQSDRLWLVHAISFDSEEWRRAPNCFLSTSRGLSTQL